MYKYTNKCIVTQTHKQAQKKLHQTTVFDSKEWVVAETECSSSRGDRTNTRYVEMRKTNDTNSIMLCARMIYLLVHNKFIVDFNFLFGKIVITFCFTFSKTETDASVKPIKLHEISFGSEKKRANIGFGAFGLIIFFF